VTLSLLSSGFGGALCEVGREADAVLGQHIGYVTALVCNGMVVRINAMRVSLLSVRMCVVSVGMATMAVTVVVEEEEADDVGEETARTDNEDDDGVGNFLWLDKSLDSLEEDGETERDEKDTVDEGTQSFCTLPLVHVNIIVACHLVGHSLRMCMSLSLSFG
jgi:hypothetical protein